MDRAIAYTRIPVADLGKAIGTSGRATILYGFNVVADVTGTGPSVQFYNGVSELETLVLHYNTTADVPTTIMFPEGITFPSGCFVDVASAPNVVQITAFYEHV